jgi:hypothetical protein
MWLQLWQRNTLMKGFAPTAGSLPIGRISVPQLLHSRMSTIFSILNGA